MNHVLGWLLVAGMFAAVAYSAWCEWLIHVQDRDDLRNLERIDTRPPPPSIHFSRDPSPRPRKRNAA